MLWQRRGMLYSNMAAYTTAMSAVEAHPFTGAAALRWNPWHHRQTLKAVHQSENQTKYTCCHEET